MHVIDSINHNHVSDCFISSFDLHLLLCTTAQKYCCHRLLFRWTRASGSTTSRETDACHFFFWSPERKSIQYWKQKRFVNDSKSCCFEETQSQPESDFITRGLGGVKCVLMFSPLLPQDTSLLSLC